MPEKYSQILDLANIDVFLETELNDSSYFDISSLPDVLSYGKHPFIISYKDPNKLPLLKDATNILFEFVDSRGTVIFSELMDNDDLSGAANGYVWVKKDPLRTADEIADGPAYFHIVGELGACSNLPSRSVVRRNCTTNRPYLGSLLCFHGGISQLLRLPSRYKNTFVKT